MISSLLIKNIATFDNNCHPIDKLKRINFFFGYNGTGKSTIVRYLQNLTLENDKKSIDFNNCSQIGYDPQKHQILVFNEEFINTNFILKDSLNGIFSLNEKNDAVDKQIKSLNQQIEYIENRIKSIESINILLNKKQKDEHELLLKKCWALRDKFENFSKINLDHSGKKTDHLNRIRKELHEGLSEVLEINELFIKYKTLYENKILEIPISIDTKKYKHIRDTERKLNKLLEEIIIGNEDVDIANLIKVLDNRKWVEEGTAYLKSASNICPFCQKQTIDKNLQDQFAKYFDDTYKNKIEKIKSLLSEYKLHSQQFLSRLKEIGNIYNKDNIISSEYDTIKELFDSNMIIMNSKINKPNEKMVLISLETRKNNLSNIIEVINEGNITFNKLEENRKLFTQLIWNYISSNSSSDILNYDQRVVKYNNIENISSRLKESYKEKIIGIKLQIEELNSQTINTKESVDNIKYLLRNAGFEGFEIIEVDKSNNMSKYQLKRPNAPDSQNTFKTLSEGEKNFISFLYFHQLCLGTDNIQNSTKKKIIVIDDPVSSLDSQSLFIVSTLIRSLIEKNKKNNSLFCINQIEQLFLLTHNVYFYKEVSLDYRNSYICSDYCHFHIKKSKNITSVENKDKSKINDDYSLLWESLKELKGNLSIDSTTNILISNTMRRIIESFINFIGISESSWGILYNKSKNDENYLIWREFISILNEESHKLSVFDAIYFQRLSSIQPSILFEVFKNIFLEIGKEHYEKMMGEKIVVPAPEKTISLLESEPSPEEPVIISEIEPLLEELIISENENMQKKRNTINKSHDPQQQTLFSDMFK